MMGFLGGRAFHWLLFIGMFVTVGSIAYFKGEANANATWQAKWEARLAADAMATAQYQAEQRAKETMHQQSITKVTQDAQHIIDQAHADLAESDARSVSVQQRADAIATRLASSQASLSACTTAASKAAAESARVLADVFKRADTRAGQLAGVADQARARGLACEAAYDGVRGQ